MDEPPASPSVERVERPDGRYVLYFSWPDEPAVDDGASEAETDEDE